MGKDKKKKEKQVKSVPLAEFLEKEAGGYIPIFKEIGSGESKTVINLSEAQLAPKSSFEVNIQPSIIKDGPPYPLIAKNIPYDATEDQIREFFCCKTASVDMKFDDNQRLTGVVVVSFDSLEFYKNALEKDGFKMGTRPILLTQGSKLVEIDSFQRRDNRRNFENERGSREDRGSSWNSNSKFDELAESHANEASCWRRNIDSELPDSQTGAENSQDRTPSRVVDLGAFRNRDNAALKTNETDQPENQGVDPTFVPCWRSIENSSHEQKNFSLQRERTDTRGDYKQSYDRQPTGYGGSQQNYKQSEGRSNSRERPSDRRDNYRDPQNNRYDSRSGDKSSYHADRSSNPSYGQSYRRRDQQDRQRNPGENHDDKPDRQIDYSDLGSLRDPSRKVIQGDS